MQLLKTATEFPTIVQKRIYVAALQQTPLDISLAKTDGIDPALVESCRAYHGFIMSMLSDMYDNSLLYGMNTGEYDAFLGGKKENGVKRQFPVKTLALRSKTHNCVHGYLKLLLELAKAGTVKDNKLFVAHDYYNKIRLMFDLLLTPKKKSIFNDIPYQTRIAALKRTGFNIVETENDVCITSEKFPDMFTAMAALAKSIDTVKTFGEQGL